MALQSPPHLLLLSDDILLQIFSFLPTNDIQSLSKVCQRLKCISKDKTLWNAADFRAVILPPEEILTSMGNLHPKTQLVGMKGYIKQHAGLPSWNTKIVSKTLLNTITSRAPNLQKLFIEECYLNAAKVELTSFPPSVTHLSLEGCDLNHLPAKRSYFFNISTHMPHLQVLNLTNCKWFEDHSLMAISKCPNLKELRVKGCHRVGTCPAYMILALRFGFQTIQRLDFRETFVGDSEIHCLQHRSQVTHLYFDGKLHRLRKSSNLDRITDRGLYVMGENAPNLQYLRVTNTEITDITLRSIARNLPALQHLDVRGCKVTEEGVRRLRTEVPRLTLISDFPLDTGDAPSSEESASSLSDHEYVEEPAEPSPEYARPNATVGNAHLPADAVILTIRLNQGRPEVRRVRRLSDVEDEGPPPPDPQDGN